MTKNTSKSKFNSRPPKMPLKIFGGNFDGREIYFRFGGFLGVQLALVNYFDFRRRF